MTSTGGETRPPLPQEAKMSQSFLKSFLKSFRVAFVTSALTALAVTFLSSLAQNDAAHGRHDAAARARPAAVAPVWPQTGAVRVIDTRRIPAAETAVQPARSAKRDRGAA